MLRRIALLASVLVIAGLPAAADEACKSRADLSWLLAPLPETASDGGNRAARPRLGGKDRHAYAVYGHRKLRLVQHFVLGPRYELLRP